MKPAAAATFAAFAALATLVTPPAQAQLRVRYTFQPDCFRPTLTSPCDPRKSGTRLDLGPQIAVWVESADRTRFIDTLLVTNAVGFRGIGNRPGHTTLSSNPKFPYGKRPMALPVWAHARGRLYDTLVMQDGIDKELWLGFHEAASSPDPYFCRPMTLMEIDVDAISCPTAVFNSVKGRFAKSEPKSYYPPRNDLRHFVAQDCDDVQGIPPNPNCAMSARQFADINDLDAVTMATPPYGRPHTGTWIVPAAIPNGRYALLVEVSKEFDTNSSHSYRAHTDPNLTEWGLKNNFGQPSVVYRVEFDLDRAAGDQAATTDIAGYGDWSGKDGTLRTPDTTISDAPGSGRGRLLLISHPPLRSGGAPVMGRVHVMTDAPVTIPPTPGMDAGAAAPPDAAAVGSTDAVSATARDAETTGPPPCVPITSRVTGLAPTPDGLGAVSATLAFVEPRDESWPLIENYHVRYWEGTEATLASFDSGAPIGLVTPEAAGRSRTVNIPDLRGGTTYTIGVKPAGVCLDGIVAFRTLTTDVRKFKQLSGCFVATAAYGSAQAEHVDSLRRLRDAVRGRSALAAAAISLYERASPPLADVLRDEPGARALVRRALAPIAGLASLTSRAVPAVPSRSAARASRR
jgi:hypothetical protein